MANYLPSGTMAAQCMKGSMATMHVSNANPVNEKLSWFHPGYKQQRQLEKNRNVELGKSFAIAFAKLYPINAGHPTGVPPCHEFVPGAKIFLQRLYPGLTLQKLCCKIRALFEEKVILQCVEDPFPALSAESSSRSLSGAVSLFFSSSFCFYI
eukprot:TRINITY_DN504_c1_g1_i1.p1 TRINITY_DN504_c1_g1~~TRINITY_DN504_c1_g1_i1.p1  ORF type:complete len:153 (+),score=13.20 TRINITY_DN504_c1_g1_i1:150-608(+)